MAELVAGMGSPSAKSHNNNLIPLRGVFDLWVANDPRNRTSPMLSIENSKPQKARPNPFETEEVEIILADMAQHYDSRVSAYFEFAFFTGMRPEERIALRWTDIDWRKREALVQRAKSFHGLVKDTKTKEERDVELNSRALAALERMRP